MLALTVVVLLAALGVAGHRLTEYEWPWQRRAGSVAGRPVPPEPLPEGLLGATRTLLPRTGTAREGGEAVTPGLNESAPPGEHWPDYSAAIPDGCQELTEEDIPLGAASDPEEAVTGEDLEAYLDKLDELALRVSLLVTGQLKDELIPALRDWVGGSDLSGDLNRKPVMAAFGPPDWDEAEIAAKNRYFLELYEQATSQPE